MIIIRILIAESDPAIQVLLKDAISKFKNAEIIGIVDSGLSAIKTIHSTHIDVIFLDIDTIDVTGLDVARHIRNLSRFIFIVFVTKYNFFLKEAIELYAFDYLTIPFNNERIIRTLGHIYNLIKQKNNYKTKLNIRSSRDNIFINVEDIVFIAKEGRYSIIKTLRNSIKTIESLDIITTKLPRNYFNRCHRGYVVNLNMIKRIAPWGNKKTYNITMATGDNIFMARQKANEVIKRLNMLGLQ